VACAVLAAPAAAVTSPHWYVNSVKLVKPKTVKTEAGLTIGPFLLIPGTPPVTVSCKFRDAETLENPASGGAGVDQMKVFSAISCGNPCPVNSAGVQPKFKVKALGLPWKTELVEVPPIADEIQGVKLEFSCKKVGSVVLSGTLSPWVNVNQLEFTATTGTLSGAPVIGFDNFLPPNVVEAINP
jgi:hypothetical protein